jgi:hypothetical protein
LRRLVLIAANQYLASTKWLTFVVITAVVGEFVSEIGTSACCTAIAATPNIPAITASIASVSRYGPAHDANGEEDNQKEQLQQQRLHGRNACLLEAAGEQARQKQHEHEDRDR